MPRQSKFLKRPRIDPKVIDGGVSLTELVDRTFLSYNAGRLREACQLFARRMLDPDVTVGVSISGALTPAGLGISSFIPLIEAGFIDCYRQGATIEDGRQRKEIEMNTLSAGVSVSDLASWRFS